MRVREIEKALRKGKRKEEEGRERESGMVNEKEVEIMLK